MPDRSLELGIAISTATVIVVYYYFFYKQNINENATSIKNKNKLRRNILHNKWSKSKIENYGDIDDIIIGSGMSGLSCAAILARVIVNLYS